MPRAPTAALVALAALVAPRPSAAFAPTPRATPATSHVGARRAVTWTAPAAAAATLAELPGWRALWDADTGVPLRLWGPPVAAPGAQRDPTRAEAAARAFLGAHLPLLAPGAAPADFVLVANQLGAGGVRTVAFEQRRAGARVVGGAIGFAFQADRLALVSSTALPGVDAQIDAPVATRSAPRTRAVIAAAGRWLAAVGAAARPRPDAEVERVILPVKRAGRVEYRVADRVLAAAEAPRAERWQIYLDAADGAPLAREDVLATFAGTIAFDTPDQRPTSTRSAHPAPFVRAVIDGQVVTTDGSGAVALTAGDPASVAPGLSGPFVAVFDGQDALAADTLSLADGGTLVWSRASDPRTDAELDAFIAASRAKTFGQTHIDPTLPFFAQTMAVTVNENATCNAYSTGDDLHFYRAGTFTFPDGTTAPCENAARVVDIVAHETGHSIHAHSVIPGQGAFGDHDSIALSEGMADTLAASITGDHGVGRGFFLSDRPLRDLAPAGRAKRWPQDADGDVHDEGEIIGEALWDLRGGLATSLGVDAGFARLMRIYDGIMQRAPNIPAAYVEALLADDDDGDLTNGTPNQCAIEAAFARHGLADPARGVGVTPPTRDGAHLVIAAPHRADACPTEVTWTGGALVWRLRGGPETTVPLAPPDASGALAATLPDAPAGATLEYRLELTRSDGLAQRFPDNAADPDYQLFVGDVTPLSCTSFETGFEGWTHGGTQDDWQEGRPLGLGGDPTVAHSGVGVLGTDLGGGQRPDGLYSAFAAETLTSPRIDLMGYEQVHLQYWRWLQVEDAAFDQATITANGTTVWSNRVTSVEPSGRDEVNHIDLEWVFADVDLTAALAGSGALELGFGLDANGANQYAGWTIDDVCVVAVGPRPPSGSGDAGPPTIVHAGGGCASGGASGPLAWVVAALAARRRRATRGR